MFSLQNRALLEQFDENPAPFMEALRQQGPVVQDPMMGIFHVTGRAEMELVLRDGATFSSAAVAMVLEPLFGVTMVQLDGPAHLKLRHLVSAAFTPRAIDNYAGTIIEPLCEDAIAALRGRSHIEFVRDFCHRFPLAVMARLLGVPMVDFDRFYSLANDLVDWMRVIPPDFSKQPVAIRASEELSEYLRPIVRERVAAARGTAACDDSHDDLLGHMARAEVDGAQLDEEEIVRHGKALLWAGAETTDRALATTLVGILQSGVRDEVRRDPQLLENCIDEALRWVAPAQSVVRLTTCNTTLAGVAIPAGTLVVLHIAAHHADPAAYPQPDQFQPRRCPMHMAFGDGRHTCMGKHLARTELRIGLERFLEAFPDVRLDPTKEVKFRGLGLRSPAAIHLLTK